MAPLLLLIIGLVDQARIVDVVAKHPMAFAPQKPRGVQEILRFLIYYPEFVIVQDYPKSVQIKKKTAKLR